jgi:hypothetical protein
MNRCTPCTPCHGRIRGGKRRHTRRPQAASSSSGTAADSCPAREPHTRGVLASSSARRCASWQYPTHCPPGASPAMQALLTANFVFSVDQQRGSRACTFEASQLQQGVRRELGTAHTCADTVRCLLRGAPAIAIVLLNRPHLLFAHTLQGGQRLLWHDGFKAWVRKHRGRPSSLSCYFCFAQLIDRCISRRCAGTPTLFLN